MDHLSLGGLVLVASEYIVHIVHFALSLMGVRTEDGKVQVLCTCGQYMGEVRRAVAEAHDFTTGRPITIMPPPPLLILLLFVFFFSNYRPVNQLPQVN